MHMLITKSEAQRKVSWREDKLQDTVFKPITLGRQPKV